MIGHSRISRSLFIAKHCDALAIEAYKTAIKEIKEHTFNIAKYTRTIESFNVTLGNQDEPLIPLDQDWITNAQNKSKDALDSLENELKAAKNNLVKEDIRVK